MEISIIILKVKVNTSAIKIYKLGLASGTVIRIAIGTAI